MSPASSEPMKGCEPEPWLAKVQDPGLGIRPKREMEYAEWIRDQAETWKSAGVPMLVFDVPSHGASMLVEKRAGAESRKVLKSVRKFMGSLQRDEGVEIASADWRLRGDFRTGLREGRRPAVLLLNKANGDRKAYERLAAELARRGISSLRLDLRGHGESINAGKFIPFDEANNSKIFVDEDVDVVSALAWLRSRLDVDSDRIGVVGASYSGELAAQAARREGKFARAYALLSPGSLSEESVKGMDPSGARWLFIRAARERAPSLPLAAAQIEAVSRSGTVRVLDSDKHATDLLAEPLALAPSLADWLHDALDGSKGGQTALAH
jgi:pimeloyl-ACP methyl ester carboxylesterase